MSTYTRRHLLLAGTGILVGFAGCSDDGNDGAQETTAESPVGENCRGFGARADDVDFPAQTDG